MEMFTIGSRCNTCSLLLQHVTSRIPCLSEAIEFLAFQLCSREEEYFNQARNKRLEIEEKLSVFIIPSQPMKEVSVSDMFPEFDDFADMTEDQREKPAEETPRQKVMITQSYSSFFE